MREIKMDPSLVGESSFSAANPSPYSLAEIWSFPINVNGRGGGGLELRMGSFSGFGDVATNRDVSVDESTVTEQSGSRGNGGGGHGGRKKREANSEDESSKLVSTSSGNDLNDSNGKPMKVSGSSDGNGSSKAEVEASSGEDNKPSEQVSKPSEPPKDYIHVSARRAPAIGSHSLAERVRRVKISERMKILQDLVPGCNKVTGKALLLDEIINYIQSLQRQVEFLSMKLEAVNSGLNPTMEGVPLKDLVPPTFDVAGMIFGSQAPREYAHVSQPEWLHMQMIEGESGLCNKGTVEALDSVVIDAMDVSCNCGTMAVLKTSWTNQNPGRRFYTCGKSMAGRCGFFVWCDPPMCLRARQIIPELINHISTVENQLRRRRRREICWWMVLIILWLLLWLMWSCNHEYVVKSPSIQNSKCIGYWVINYINLGTKVVLMVVQ